jgi:outer membrane protein assembly factor BamB
MGWPGKASIATLAAVLALLGVPAGAAAAAPIGAGADQARTSWYPDASGLSPDVVAGGTFGRRFSTPVTGQVYAQPIVARGVLLVATEANRVYGLDPATGDVRWSRDLGTPWDPSEIGCGDLTPTIGVTGTPVVDPDTGTAYLFSKGYASGSSGPVRWQIHAIDVQTGAERPNFPVTISGPADNDPGTTFQPATQLQRPALLLLNGVVYAGFGSDCDVSPFKGWVVGVSTGGAITARWTAAPGPDDGAGIWQAGGGLVSDRPGQILLMTGNQGAFDGSRAGTSPPPRLGESVVRLHVQGDGTLSPTDFFEPYDAPSLDTWDADFASGAPMALPDAPFGTPSHRHLMVAAGKEGYVYLLDRDHLGGMRQGPGGGDDVVDRIGPYGGVWARPAVWPGDGGYVYIPTASGGTTSWGTAGVLRMYKAGVGGSGLPTLALAGTSTDAFGFSSSGPVVTSSGTQSGSALVWLIWSPDGSGGGAQLRAYDAVPSNGAPVLRFSAPVGQAAKFAPPGVAGNRLYVGTRDGHVLGFGVPVTPSLNGSGLAFDSTTVGQQQTKTATLTATRHVTVTAVSASPTQFTAGTPAPAAPVTLEAGDQITVPVTFAPTGAGSLGGALTVQFSDGQQQFTLTGDGRLPAPKLTASAPAISFGGAPVGAHLTESVVYTNTGGASLTIGTAQPPQAPFSVDGLPAQGHTLASGESVTVNVSFSPTSTGSYLDELTLNSTGGNVTVGLSGQAQTPGHLVIQPGGLDFGSVAPGAAVTQSFALRNDGGSSVMVTRSKPPISGVFVATTSLDEGTVIGPGQTLVEEARFAPTAPGSFDDAWAITTTDGSGEHAVPLHGVAATAAGASAPGEPPRTTPAGPKPIVLRAIRVTPRHLPRRGWRTEPITVRFELSVPARIRFTLARRVPWSSQAVPLLGAHVVAARAGRNRVRFTLRWASGRLSPGTYLLALAPDGGPGPTRHTRLSIGR